MSAFEQLEVLYNRLNFTVRPRGRILKVHRPILGDTFEHKIAVYTPALDGDVLDFAERLDEQEGDFKIIVDGQLDNEEMEVFQLASDAVYTLDQWLNRLLRSGDACEKLQQSNLKYGATTFVTPALAPIKVEDLYDWATGKLAAEESLGRIVVLTGPAGTGKTTLARRVARQIAERHLEDESSPVPIFIALEDFRAERRWDDILANYSREMQIPEITPNALQFYVNHGRAILVVDGLDEMAERGGPDAATETLRQLSEYVAATGRVLVTARDLYLTRFRKALNLPETSFVRIQGILESEREQLLWDRSEDVRRRVRELLTHARFGISDLATSPLFVVMLANAVEETGDSLDAGITGVELLRKVFSNVHKREMERQKLELTVRQYESLFGDLALEAIEGGSSGGEEDNLAVPSGELHLQMWTEEQIEEGDTAAAEEEARRKRKRMLTSIRSHRFFDPTAIEEDEVLRFDHPFFRDACASFGILERIQEGRSLNVGPLEAGERVTQFVAELLSEIEIPVRVTDCAAGVASYLVAKALIDVSREKEITSASMLASRWSELNLGGLTVSNLKFDDITFDRTRLNGCTFRRCEFHHCELIAAFIAGADFSFSVATQDVINQLKSRGVDELPSLIEVDGKDNVTADPIETFAREAFRSFLQKFIRHERKKHKRSVVIPAFTRGVSVEVGIFTTECIIPTMKAIGLVDVVQHVNILRFNSDFQDPADRLLFDDEIAPEFEEVFRSLVEDASRHVRGLK